MSKLILADQVAFLDGYKISSQANTMAMDMGLDAPECTTFASNANREYTPGLKTMGGSMAGFFDQSAADAHMFNNLGAAQSIVTIGPQNGTAGSPVYFLKALETAYTPLTGNVGDLVGFSLGFNNKGSPGVVRGTLMLNTAAIAGSGNSTGRQLGAVGATQKVYGALHVTGITGSPSLVVKAQSDDNSGFTSATDRLTFATMTDVGTDWQELAGAITDDYWRINYAFSGSGSIDVVVSLGIK
jgi:hypothetical protein